jgi:phosphoglucosamine mutase
LEALPGLTKAIQALEAKLGTKGRVLVRWSGTEAKLRLLVEGEDEAGVQEGMDKLQAAARSELDVIP